ncbi:hypothetical protein R2F25_07180 [Streptomyces sp. UP1A-1]|nr:hypothetical protein [Streptomyces sp. UP1A-1]
MTTTLGTVAAVGLGAERRPPGRRSGGCRRAAGRSAPRPRRRLPRRTRHAR